jgi:16S rRNA (cytidine1402-2'-O)-methyltransferase
VSKIESALYIVATPIGNLSDITLRALETLKNVDFVACEDTRNTQVLLNHFKIIKKLIGLHQHNEKQKKELILSLVRDGKSVAYVSDAGTPCISDPGALLVNSFYENNLKVIPIPGVSAITTAFSVSGILDNQFKFYGFLSNQKKKLKEELQAIYENNNLVILYESPHRIIELLENIKVIFGTNHQIVIARELTKIFETIKRDTVENILSYINGNSNHKKGEFVVIILPSGIVPDKVEENDLKNALSITQDYLPTSQSVKLISTLFKKNKKEVYNLAIKKKND